jgi:hypothetical protein
VFDFRYHVASLAAVFLALVIGILVGVGISGRGLVDKSERRQFQKQIAILQSDLESAQARASSLDQQQHATKTFVQDAYPALMVGRLQGKRIAIVVIGRDDGSTGAAVQQALQDAGALDVVRYRAIKVPVDPAALRAPLVARKPLAAYAGAAHVGDLGRELARELVKGGKAPAWDALSDQLLDERRGASTSPADGVVVIRTAAPQSGVTSRFLAGLYDGLASAGVPAVGVERTASVPSAVPAFTRADLSTVDDVDQPLGKLALVLLLEGVDTGHFGVGKQTAPDGTLPTIVPLQPAATPGA